MSRLRFLPAIVIFLLLPFFSVSGQTQVTKSTEKVVVDGKVYYLHTVLKGQTAYSISKAYGITVEELQGANPSVAKGTREGEVLRIPAGEAPRTLPADVISKGMIYHYMATGETVYSLSRRYNVKEEDIVNSNPGLSINNISIGTRIAIPVSGTGQQASTAREQQVVTQTKPAAEQRTEDGKHIYHKVLKGETLSSLSRDYNVSLRDLKRANKGMLFPKEGDYVMIPAGPRTAETPSHPEESIAAVEMKNLEMHADTVPGNREPEITDNQFTPVDRLRGSVRVAVLLPFFLEDNTLLSYSDSSFYDIPFVEMYEGILIAADSLRSMGLKVELDVYDTGDDSVKVQRLIESGRLGDADLILGPVFSSNLATVGSYAAGLDIPVVSPVPLRDQNILEGRPTIFKICPSYIVEQNAIARYTSLIPDANVVLLYSDSLMYDPRTVAFRNKLTRVFWDQRDSSGFKEFFFSGRMIKKTNIYKDAKALEALLSTDNENVVIIATNDPPKVAAALSILHSLSRRYSIRVAGTSEIREGGTETIDLKYLYDLKMIFPSEKYIDYSRPEVNAFVRAFYKKFRTEPDEDNFAWRGFDMAYYFIAATARYGKSVYNRNEGFRPPLASYDFSFHRADNSDGFENQNMFIIQYNPDRTITVTALRDMNKGRDSFSPVQ